MNNFYEKLNKNIRLYPPYRYGQAVFNTMFELYPDVAQKYCGSKYDPFHDNTKINIFIEKCNEEINE